MKPIVQLYSGVHLT